MQTEPLISIVIPVYNVEPYLRDAINSALSQTYKNKEIILVDDGSTDSSSKICDDYAAEFGCIKVIHQKNRGLSAARNSGIKAAQGEYIAFLDSDDEYGDIRMIEHYIDIYSKNKDIEIIQFPTIKYKNEKSCEITGKTNISLIGKDRIMQSILYGSLQCTVCDKIYKKEIFGEYKFTEGRFFEDIWLMVDLLQSIKRIEICNYGFYKYKIREGSITQTRYSILKCRQDIEVKLKMLNLIKRYDVKGETFVRNYTLLQNCFLEYCHTFDIENFIDLTSEINKYKPQFHTLISNARITSINNIIKILISKLIGIKNTSFLYNLKNHRK